MTALLSALNLTHKSNGGFGIGPQLTFRCLSDIFITFEVSGQELSSGLKKPVGPYRAER